MSRALTINLIGPGKVGQTLCRRIANGGLHTIQDVFGRNAETAAQAVQFIGSGVIAASLSAMRPADIWLITVPDTKIAAVASELGNHLSAGSAIALHCSGFLPADEMKPLRSRGWQLVSAHPVMTFADPQLAVERFGGTQCGIEGDAPACELIAALFQEIGARTFTIQSENKALYHSGAVLSSNFAVVLQALAREAWMKAGLSEGVARELNDTLLKAVVDNVTALGPQAALTGPAARGDWTVVARQQEAVGAWHPEAGKAYESLSLMARRLKRLGLTSQPSEEEG